MEDAGVGVVEHQRIGSAFEAIQENGCAASGQAVKQGGPALIISLVDVCSMIDQQAYQL